MSSTSENDSGIRTVCSSMSATPDRPGPFIGTNGITCFWPESATAQNHEPACARRKNSRTIGFSPLLALAYPGACKPAQPCSQQVE